MLRRKRIKAFDGSKPQDKESPREKTVKTPLGSKRKNKQPDEEQLEKLVLGGECDVLQTLQEVSKKVKISLEHYYSLLFVDICILHE